MKDAGNGKVAQQAEQLSRSASNSHFRCPLLVRFVVLKCCCFVVAAAAFVVVIVVVVPATAELLPLKNMLPLVLMASQIYCCYHKSFLLLLLYVTIVVIVVLDGLHTLPINLNAESFKNGQQLRQRQQQQRLAPTAHELHFRYSEYSE